MLKNMKIGARLLFGFGLMLVIAARRRRRPATGACRTSSGRSSEKLATDGMLAQHTSRARANTNALRRFEKDLFLNIGDAAKEEQYYKDWLDQVERLTRGSRTPRRRPTSREEKEQLRVMKTELAAYEAGFEKVRAQIQAGSVKTPQEGNVAIGPYKDGIRKLEDTAKELSDTANKRLDELEGVVAAIAGRIVGDPGRADPRRRRAERPDHRGHHAQHHRPGHRGDAGRRAAGRRRPDRRGDLDRPRTRPG